ncbi:MAG TPA: hypothetical protein VNZ22_14910, partial [Bacillota bacterium]|nr:hypothetical protein [Bacillota bacterium]
MTELLLRRSLEPVARREQIWRRRRAMAIYWVAAAALGVLITLFVHHQGLAGQWPALIFAGTAMAGALVLWRRISRAQPDYRQLARDIEQQHPSLHALLLTAVEQHPDPATGRLNYLQEQTIQQAIEASQRQLWTQTISDRRLTSALVAQCACLLFFSGSLRWLAAQQSSLAAKRSPAEWQVTVSPGDTLLEKGASLVVQARFPGRVPATATLVATDGSTNILRIPLAKTLADPVFGGAIPAVEKELRYHVEYGERRSPGFKVALFEYPRLEKADIAVRFPAYTGWPEKRIADTRRVSAVEGSRLAVELHLNKRVRSAVFIASNQPPLALRISTNAPLAEIPDYLLQHSAIYDLRLVDAEGRANKLPARFVFEALPNRPPQLKLLSPHGDQRVSPLEEIQFSGEATDDFGLRAYGLSYLLPGRPPLTITLGSEAKGNEKRTLQHLLALEELRARPDQLISYHLWADDYGP